MAATITGIVFDDLNHNGIYDVGEPPIPNAYVVRQRVGGGCVTVQTDAFGVYTFSNINLAGTHIIYETAVNPGGACPPTLFGQPPGFTNSTTFRTETINLTQNDIDNNVTINANNYGHDNPDTFFCAPFGYQVAATGGNSQFVKINLVTGTATVINPDIGFAVNAIGYNVLDNMIYGIITQGNVGNVVRIAEDGTTTDMGTVTNLPAAGYFIGSFDNAGHLFVYISNQANYYVIDLDQNSPYFGQLVDPTGGAFTPTASGKPIINPISIADWAYNVLDGQLYALENSTFTIQTIDPLTGIVTPVPTVGVLPTSAGASFMDGTGTLYEIYNPTGDIYRVTFSGGTATGALFSQTVTSTGNDGASCHDAEVIIDFGDAPDTGAGNGFGNYSTLLANNGPRHQIINPLTLGTQVTGEQDALQ
ncbi:DUF6923 family protein, partial [Paraclostridium bifermentans]|uniref:DUF6923 family protein n=1 Tax=Paraclostridium bifermentans TaxID=1490 RepID=UPI00359C3773